MVTTVSGVSGARGWTTHSQNTCFQPSRDSGSFVNRDGADRMRPTPGSDAHSIRRLSAVGYGDVVSETMWKCMHAHTLRASTCSS
eukprot:295685-Rhodomonas_salina.3